MVQSNRFRGIRNNDRLEYSRLVAKQVIGKEVDLAFSVNAGGCIFLCVGKKGTDKMREVWHVARVSDASHIPLTYSHHHRCCVWKQLPNGPLP